MIELLELSQVLDAVRNTGTEVHYYDQRCDTHKVAGFYQLNANVDRLVICPSNQRNHSDLFDTIRHEAIHVVQACNGGAVLDREYYSKNTDPDIQKWVQQNYPEQHHHVELEAAMGAKYLSEGDVIKLINKYCFE